MKIFTNSHPRWEIIKPKPYQTRKQILATFIIHAVSGWVHPKWMLVISLEPGGEQFQAPKWLTGGNTWSQHTWPIQLTSFDVKKTIFFDMDVSEHKEFSPQIIHGLIGFSIILPSILGAHPYSWKHPISREFLHLTTNSVRFSGMIQEGRSCFFGPMIRDKTLLQEVQHARMFVTFRSFHRG